MEAMLGIMDLCDPDHKRDYSQPNAHEKQMLTSDSRDFLFLIEYSPSEGTR